MAIRYVAMFTLEQITGEHATISYFDDDRAQQDAAIATWRRWYEQHAVKHRGRDAMRPRSSAFSIRRD